MNKTNRSLTALMSPAVVFFACQDQATNPTALTDEPALQAAVTPATRTEFQGFIHFCASFPGERAWVTPGGVFHLRDGSNRSQWVTGNPLLDGFEENAGDLNLNLKTGDGWVHLKAILTPDAVDGTWEMTLRVPLPPASGPAVRVGHGTGDLQGMTIKATAVLAPGLDNVCNPDMAGTSVQGVIISPANAN